MGATPAQVRPVAGYAPRTLAEIAAGLPGATAVLRKHTLDVWCDGQIPLAEAVASRGVALEAIEAELAALAQTQAQAPEDTKALIELIETRFHAPHRRELPELIRLARRVEAVHGDEAPHGLAALLEEFGTELESHMQQEELILFPLMRRGGHPMLGHPIGAMRADHDGHSERLRALEALIRGGGPPAGACNTCCALYAGTRKLVDDLMEHIHLENNILFPMFEG